MFDFVLGLYFGLLFDFAFGFGLRLLRFAFGFVLFVDFGLVV